jgi:hypothetical protein
MARTPNDDRSDSMNPTSVAYNPRWRSAEDDDTESCYSSVSVWGNYITPRPWSPPEPRYERRYFALDIACLNAPTFRAFFHVEFRAKSNGEPFDPPTLSWIARRWDEEIAGTVAGREFQALLRKRLEPLHYRIRGAGDFDCRRTPRISLPQMALASIEEVNAFPLIPHGGSIEDHDARVDLGVFRGRVFSL